MNLRRPDIWSHKYKTIKLFSIDLTYGLTNTWIVPGFVSLQNKNYKTCLLV